MPEPSFSLEDKMAIQEVIALYGHIIDDRQFSRLNEIFTTDAVFDLSGYGGERYEGLPAIEALMLNSNEHPLAHHASNIVIEVDGSEGSKVKTKTDSANQHQQSLALVTSKGLGVGAGGRVGSVVYRDCFVRINTGHGKERQVMTAWRIQTRFCELRSVNRIPQPS